MIPLISLLVHEITLQQKSCLLLHSELKNRFPVFLSPTSIFMKNKARNLEYMYMPKTNLPK